MSFKKILTLTIIILSLVTIGLLLIVYSFMDIKLSSLDGKGELVETIKSPNLTYQADTYIIYGNEQNKNQVRVSITNIKNKGKYKDTTIYWLYPAEENLPKITWISEDIIQIENQKIDIHSKKTYYNWRKDKALIE